MLRRNSALIFLLLMCAFTFTLCTSGGQAGGPISVLAFSPTKMPRSPASVRIPFKTIIQGAPLGDHPSEPLYTVVAFPDKWNELCGRLPDQAIKAGIQASRLSDDLIVIAFAGVKSTSGYNIEVKSIVQEGDQLFVDVAQTMPNSNDIVEPATTLPIHLVALSRNRLHLARLLRFTFRDAHRTILGQEDIGSFWKCGPPKDWKGGQDETPD